MTIYSGPLRLKFADVIVALFSTVFLALLGSSFYGQRTYSYIFLAVFLWLGFLV